MTDYLYLLAEAIVKTGYRPDPREEKRKRLTPRLIQVLELIERCHVAGNYSPSIREICDSLEIKSPATAHSHLSRLAEAGYIKRGSWSGRKAPEITLVHPVGTRYRERL